MQRRTFFQSLFGGMGAAMLSRYIQADERTILLQESPVAGFQYHRGDAIWPFLREGEDLSLVRESFNGHDHDAVAVYFRNDKLGFIPRGENRAIAQMLDRGEKLNTKITRLLDENNPWRRVRISISLG